VPSYRTASSAAVMDARGIDLGRWSIGAVLSHLGAGLLRAALALGRSIWRRPLDSLAVATAAVATGAILINAMFLQVVPHPAPMLPGKPRPVATTDTTGSVASLAQPAKATASVAVKPQAPSSTRTGKEIISDIQRELSRRGFYDGPTDGVYGARTDAAIRDFEQATGLKGNAQPDEALLKLIMRSNVNAPAAAPLVGVPAAIPVPPPRPASAPRAAAAPKPVAPAKRVLAVQRALADYGYGQLTPNGILGPETKSAIERFERERKLPISGQISDRLTRELAAITGRPLD
jgi:peptidoglycan hydrolase-like protein with peptidoglycan-binding domain